MKRKLYILSFCCIMLFGCEKMLTEEPATFLDENTIFSTQNGTVAAVLGVYESLRESPYYGQVLLTCITQHADYAFGRGSQVPMGNYQLDANSVVRVGTIWNSIYSTINRANIVIEKLPDLVFIDENMRDQLKSEALFLRALSYHHLVRLWGAVPLRLTPEVNDFSLGRSPVQEVYTQIINDLKIAEADLPDSYVASQNGRATKWAAKMLLADIYLTQENWPDAAAKALEVISSDKFSLVQVNSSLDFQTKLFGPDIATHAEDIFSLKFSVIRDNDSWVRFFHKPEPGYSKGGPHAILGNPNSFIYQGEWATEDSEDLRRNHSLYSGADAQYLNASVPALFRKFRGTTTNVSNNTPIFRYAEALLIYAEAASQANSGPTSDAYDAINKVRRRAFGVDLNTANPTSDIPADLNASDFRDAVLLERGKELLVEGKRWYDLLRTNTAIQKVMEAKSIALTEKSLKWPIPQPELDNNDALTQADQNPGW